MKVFNAFMTCFAVFLAIHLVLWAFGVPPLWGEIGNKDPRGIVLVFMHAGTFIYIITREVWA